MRTFSLAAMAMLGMLCFGRCAHAQWEVQDIATETNTGIIQGDTAAINSSTAAIRSFDDSIQTNTNDTAKSTAATYSMFTTKTDVGDIFKKNDDSSVQNAMPAAGLTADKSSTTIASALSFKSPGTIDGNLTIYNQNNLPDAVGTDPVAVAQDTVQRISANIQTMAALNLNALQKRLSDLDEMSQALSDATTITQVNAITGRISVESIAVQAEQAQAANLAALATAQAEINRENEAQAMRQEHTKTSSLFADAAKALILTSGVIQFQR